MVISYGSTLKIINNFNIRQFSFYEDFLDGRIEALLKENINELGYLEKIIKIYRLPPLTSKRNDNLNGRFNSIPLLASCFFEVFKEKGEYRE